MLGHLGHSLVSEVFEPDSIHFQRKRSIILSKLTCMGHDYLSLIGKVSLFDLNLHYVRWQWWCPGRISLRAIVNKLPFNNQAIEPTASA